jgi:hypothetical protein
MANFVQSLAMSDEHLFDRQSQPSKPMRERPCVGTVLHKVILCSAGEPSTTEESAFKPRSGS